MGEALSIYTHTQANPYSIRANMNFAIILILIRRGKHSVFTHKQILYVVLKHLHIFTT